MFLVIPISICFALATYKALFQALYQICYLILFSEHPYIIHFAHEESEVSIC